MRDRFIDYKFSKDSLTIITTANNILTEYEAMGYDLSLRQIYYQFVARAIIENSERSYKRLGDIVSNARLAGLLDWDMIRDRGRVTRRNTHWNNPAEIIESAARQFAINKWENQPVHVEVMVEKQALEGVLIPECIDLDISFTANKGYSSSSALYEAGQRLSYHIAEGKHCIVIYLGDHDPSGIDMSRDVECRLRQFARSNASVEVQRVALNMDQIRKLKPPPNPTKITDSRANGYIREFGYESWELDALDPKFLASLVRDAVYEVRDIDLWEEAIQKEEKMKNDLKRVVTQLKKRGE